LYIKQSGNVFGHCRSFVVRKCHRHCVPEVFFYKKKIRGALMRPSSVG